MNKVAEKHNTAIQSQQDLGIKMASLKDKNFTRTLASQYSSDDENNVDKLDDIYKTLNSSKLSRRSRDSKDPNLNTIDVYNVNKFLESKHGESIKTFKSS